MFRSGWSRSAGGRGGRVVEIGHTVGATYVKRASFHLQTEQLACLTPSRRHHSHHFLCADLLSDPDHHSQHVRNAACASPAVRVALFPRPRRRLVRRTPTRQPRPTPPGALCFLWILYIRTPCDYLPRPGIRPNIY